MRLPFSQMRARYGTGDFLNLQKRNCSTKLKLTPYGADILQVIWDIGGDHHVFYPSAVMGYQFSLFMDAVYALYYEELDNHRILKQRDFKYEEASYSDDSSIPPGHIRKKTSIQWDFEGYISNISFECIRKWACPVHESEEPDLVKVTIDLDGHFEYTIDGKELCYAIADACTRALKAYGIRGYRRTTALNEHYGDEINFIQLLFFKAYALDAMEVRGIRKKWENPDGWEGADCTSFDKELELLLFNM